MPPQVGLQLLAGQIGQYARVGDNDTGAGQLGIQETAQSQKTLGPMSVRPPYSNLCWMQGNIWCTSQEESHFHSSYHEFPQVTGKKQWERDGVPSLSVHSFCLCPLAWKDLGWPRKAVPPRLTPILSCPLCLHGLSSPVICV